jgi:hypothetical protein
MRLAQLVIVICSVLNVVEAVPGQEIATATTACPVPFFASFQPLRN